MFKRIRDILRRRGPVELAIMIADRVTRPFGLSLISFTRFGAVPPRSGSHGGVFETAARENVWGSPESLSGEGSELKATAAYRVRLRKLLPRFDSMFDAPCGDMNWMPAVIDEVGIAYRGGDIAPYVIELNRKKFPHLSFEVFDITVDRFPKFDLWHCRDCLFHLSFEDIARAIRNFRKSEIAYALITTHQGIIRNVDNPTGGWRYLDLTRWPFNFPQPELVLKDSVAGQLPRVVGLWKRESLPNFSASAAA